MLVALMPVGEALWVEDMQLVRGGEDLLVRSTPSAQVRAKVFDSTRRYKIPSSGVIYPSFEPRSLFILDSPW